MGDLILDMIRQTIIKVVPEGTFSIALDLHCNLVELDHVLGDTLTILHGQVGEWKLIVGEASPSGHSSMHAPGVRDSGRALEAEAEVACC